MEREEPAYKFKWTDLKYPRGVFEYFIRNVEDEEEPSIKSTLSGALICTGLIIYNAGITSWLAGIINHCLLSKF